MGGPGEGWNLLGVLEAVRAHREQLRVREWDRLAVLGADIAWMEDSTEPVDKALEPPRAERLQLVSAAIGWGCSDREIAVRARVTGRVVGELRTGGAATVGQYE
ncbi:hypothetical protein [Streptomyces sp. NPDC057199]|uniref:hypothetical protein n=1 Tax=Streptomyces sp. NPDC057199 TaxID=3346047 RepID=UPI0036316AA7